MASRAGTEAATYAPAHTFPAPRDFTRGKVKAPGRRRPPLERDMADHHFEAAQQAVIAVGGGRGFVVKARNQYYRPIITAAHCLPGLPPAHPAMNLEERTVPIRLTQTPTICRVRRWKNSRKSGLDEFVEFE